MWLPFVALTTAHATPVADAIAQVADRAQADAGVVVVVGDALPDLGDADLRVVRSLSADPGIVASVAGFPVGTCLVVAERNQDDWRVFAVGDCAVADGPASAVHAVVAAPRPPKPHDDIAWVPRVPLRVQALRYRNTGLVAPFLEASGVYVIACTFTAPCGGDECAVAQIGGLGAGSLIFTVGEVLGVAGGLGEAMALRRGGVRVSLAPDVLALGCLVLAAAAVPYDDRGTVILGAVAVSALLPHVQLVVDEVARMNARHRRVPAFAPPELDVR
jgi:hypothetical protein